MRYAIVGAGYTGLAAVRRLHELDPNGTMIVLEGLEIGEGHPAAIPVLPIRAIPRSASQPRRWSGRKSSTISRRRGLTRSSRRCAMVASAVISNAPGALLARQTELGAAKIRGMVDGARQHGFAHEALDAEGMQRLIGSRYYRCGIRTEEGYLLQPAALIRGLADSLPPQSGFANPAPSFNSNRGSQPACAPTRR